VADDRPDALPDGGRMRIAEDLARFQARESAHVAAEPDVALAIGAQAAQRAGPELRHELGLAVAHPVQRAGEHGDPHGPRAILEDTRHRSERTARAGRTDVDQSAAR